MRVKDPVVHVRVRSLWKHQNNPACTKTGRDISVEGGLYTEEEEDFPVPNSPYGLCGRKATLNLNKTDPSRLR